VPQVHEQPIARQIEGGGEVGEGEAFALHRARVTARHVQDVDDRGHLAARRNGGHHLGLRTVTAHHGPIEDDVFDLERQLVFDFEGHCLGEFAAFGERKGESPHGEPVASNGRHDVVGGELVDLGEAADQLGDVELGVVEPDCADLHGLQAAKALLQLHGLDRMTAQIEPQDVPQNGHPGPPLTTRATIASAPRLLRDGASRLRCCG
jgi:hypothetical protein